MQKTTILIKYNKGAFSPPSATDGLKLNTLRKREKGNSDYRLRWP